LRSSSLSPTITKAEVDSLHALRSRPALAAPSFMFGRMVSSRYLMEWNGWTWKPFAQLAGEPAHVLVHAGDVDRECSVLDRPR